jgi:hypothetical protein
MIMSNIFTWLGSFLMEIVAVAIAIEITNQWSKYWEKKHKLDLSCDSCHKPLKLRKTKDNLYYLCYKCTKLYREELKVKKQTEQTNPEN